MSWQVEATITCEDEAVAAALIGALAGIARENDAVAVELSAEPVDDDD